jgi:hypothetical protein
LCINLLKVILPGPDSEEICWIEEWGFEVLNKFECEFQQGGCCPLYECLLDVSDEDSEEQSEEEELKVR